MASALAGWRRARDVPPPGVAADERRVRSCGMPLPPRAELEAVATEAGRLALGHFRRVAVERKADRSVVTAADREVERFLVDTLGARLPEAGIIGEEGAARPARSPYRLVFDPIDGTAAFVAGLPTWCV